MRHCQHDDQIAEAIGKGLIKNYTLKELYLRGNLITVSIHIFF